MARNHETQVVVNWINSDENLYNFVEELIKDDEIVTKYEASQRLKDEIMEGAEYITDTANMYTDLLLGALSEVNWLSIIEDFTE